MLYVSEIVDLMAAFPDRDFRIGDVIRYVRNGRELTDRQQRAMREAVVRALHALEASGSIAIIRPWVNQRGWGYYRWKMTHGDSSKCNTNATKYDTVTSG